MIAEPLAELIDTLSADEQEAVRGFIERLRRPAEADDSRFAAAVDEFIGHHTELLQRLAR